MTPTDYGRITRTGCRLIVMLSAALVAAACGGSAGQGSGPAAPTDSDELGSELGEDEAGGSAVAGDSGAASQSNVPAPPEGARAEEKRAMSLKATFKLLKEGRDAGISAKGWSFTEARTEVVEKTANGAVTQLAVVYGKREGNGLEDWTPLPTEGKGYTVKAKPGGELVVMDANDNPAATAETEVIAHEYGYLGKPNPLLAQVVSSDASSGDTIGLDSAATLALIGYMPEMEIEQLSVVHQGEEQQAGRAAVALDVTFKSALKNGEEVYALQLTGPAYVDQQTGWVLKLDLNGDVKVSGQMTHKGKQLEMRGKGTATLSRQASIR